MSEAEDQTQGGPEWLDRVLRELDGCPEGLTELAISQALSKHDEHKGGQRSPHFRVRAEQQAFRTDELKRNEAGFGKFYFRRPCSFWTLTGDERTPPMEPDDPIELLAYWARRAGVAQHPVMRARYADLVWDLGILTKPKLRDVEHARTAIAAYQKAALLPGDRSKIYDTRWLERAVQLAATIGDTSAERMAVSCYMQWFRSRARFGSIPTWLNPFECLVIERRCDCLAKEDAEHLVGYLEGILVQTVPKDNQKLVHRWPATLAARSLAEHYKREKRHDDRGRVLSTLALGFERAAANCDGESDHIGGAHWYDEASKTYKVAGRKEDAIRTRKLHGKQLRLGREKAVPTMVETPLTAAEVAELEEHYISDDLETAIRGWTYAWLSRIDTIRPWAQERSAAQQIFPSSNVGDEWITGRPPSYDQDPDAALVASCKDYVQCTAGFRQICMDAILRHHDPEPQDLYGMVAPSPLLRPDRLPLVMAGLEAHLNKDYVASIHILIPQIEAALFVLFDGLPDKSGVKEASKRKHAGMQAVAMNSILDEKDADAFLGKDIRLHLRACLCHPLGLNLRNLVCHGLCGPQYFTRGYADVVLHCLLVLGLFCGASSSNGAAADGEMEP